MHRHSIIALAAFCLLAVFVLWTQPAGAQTFVTTITVDTTEDVNDSLSQTCANASDGKCTFRRALIQASNLAPNERPALIAFDIPTTDANHEREAAGTWTVVVDEGAVPPLKTQSITNQTGQVTIDGSTQPGGRSDGPVIFLDLGDRSLEIESTENVIKNLAFINFGSISLKEDGNLVEENWMGLTGDGTAIYFRTPGDERRLATTQGVRIGSDDNIVRNNTIVGASTKAVDIDGGDNNVVTDNNIGTRADGTVPAVAEQSECVASFNYDTQNWYGGWGIGLSGSNNTISSNRIAGMQNLRAENDTAPIALEIFGSDHIISDNVIGIDADDPVNDYTGVCGQGIKVSGSGTDIVDNVVARSRTGFESNQGDALDGAILYSDNRFSPGGITVRRNLVIQGPGDIYVFGPEVVQALRLFRPARITDIDGTTVQGTNGIDPDGNQSVCPDCVIDFYQDGTDANGDALAYLGSTTANADGDFVFTLDQPLPENRGIRTSSTSAGANIIGTLAMSTTTKFSGLYIQQADLAIAGPESGEEDEPYTFSFRVTPVSLAGPITYTIEVTDFNPLVDASDSTAVSLPITWTEPGLKAIEVTADNGLISASATHTIQIGSEQPTLYLPLLGK